MNDAVKIAIDFAVLTFVYFRWLLPRWKTRGRGVLAANTLMYLYFSGVLYFTLMPVVASLPFLFNHRYISMNLIPFDDYIHGRGDTVRQIVLNIVMMVPFGVLLPVCRNCTGRKCGLLRCLLTTAAVSLCIELLQPLMANVRVADSTDIITNTAGGLLGYLGFLLLRPFIRRIFGIAEPKQR